MGKYTRYSSNYPTKYSNWMYPPKNVGFGKYLGMYASGIWKAWGPTYKANWAYGVVFVPVLYLCYWMRGASKGSKFCQSVRDPKGNWLYGPPSEKLLHEIHEHGILHAPHK